MRDIMLYLHFIGIALAIGAGFAQLFLSMSSKKLDEKSAETFLLQLLPINYMGKTGLTLLFLSGGYLMTPYWRVMGAMPLLTIKLGLVVVAIIATVLLAIFAKKAKANNGGTYLNKANGAAKAIFLLYILIALLAVLTFH